MIITLTTDFGLKDPFVAAMKGVILSVAGPLQIVDVTHEIPSFDITEAAVVIREASRYFPAGTIHVVVVDPGVGGVRRPVAIKSGTEHIFIAPDNGVLSLVRDSAVARHISNTDLFQHPVSNTFHGRDIFASVAGHVAAGVPFESLGPHVDDLVQLALPQNLTVLRIDKFGNLLTTIRRRQLGSSFVIRAGGAEIRRLLMSYEDGDAGEIFAIEGSAGLIELSMKQDSAALRLNLRPGAELEVETGTLNQ